MAETDSRVVVQEPWLRRVVERADHDEIECVPPMVRRHHPVWVMTAHPSDGTIGQTTVEAQEQRVVDVADFGADERARRLAEESRSFLEVEGFSNQRIAELAKAFVAGELGADDEFTAWAMSEGRYTSPGS